MFERKKNLQKEMRWGESSSTKCKKWSTAAAWFCASTSILTFVRVFVCSLFLPLSVPGHRPVGAVSIGGPAHIRARRPHSGAVDRAPGQCQPGGRGSAAAGRAGACSHAGCTGSRWVTRRTTQHKHCQGGIDEGIDQSSVMSFFFLNEGF